MQIPAELEKESSAIKAQMTAEAQTLADEARVLAATEKATVLTWVKANRAQVIGALVFLATLLVVYVLAGHK